MYSFLHTADIHLDSPLRNLSRYEGAPVERIRSACRRAFIRLVDLALEEQVAFILISGDLYDGDWKDYNTGLFFISQMQRLQGAGIRVFIVAGNHDAASRLTRGLRLPDNVYFFSHEKPHSILLEPCRAVVHGWSFPVRDVRDNMVPQYPQPDPDYLNIGMLHTGLTGRSGHQPYAPCSREDLLRSGYGYWALGHVHAREVVHQAPWIVFPGNIQGRHIRENGSKGASLVRVEGEVIVSVEHRDLAVLRWESCRVEGNGCRGEEEVLRRAEASLTALSRQVLDDQGLAVRLEIETGPGVIRRQAREQLENELRSLVMGLGDLWLEKVIFQTERTPEVFPVAGDPLAELLRTIASLEKTPSALMQLDGELQEFAGHLPAELFEDGGVIPGEPAQVAALCRDLRELLLDSLGREQP